MCKKMQVIIAQLEPYQKGYPIWSILYVQIDDICFPNDSWTEPTSSVLSIWLAGVDKLLKGLAENVNLPFMDGDFSLELTRATHDLVTVRCVDPENTTILEELIDLQSFARQLLSKVGIIQQHYVDNINAPALQKLFEFSEKLRTTLKQR